MSTTQAAQDLSLAENAERLLELAKKAGAPHAEVFAYGGTSLSAKVEKGDLGQVQADEGSTLGLRVIVDGRLGFASTNQTNDDSLTRAATDAVAIARMSPADEANQLPAPTGFDEANLLAARIDPALAGLTVTDAVERAQALASAAIDRDARLSVDQASFSIVTGTSLVLSTSGLSVKDQDAALTMSIMALATDGDETGGFDYRGSVVRDLSRVDAESERLSRDVAAACIGNLGARGARTYTGPVLFSPEAFATAFVSPLMSSVSAMSVQRGRSALAKKLGEQIAARLSVIDDPTDRAAAGAGAFDREGVATSRFAIVEDGVLRSFLHNAYTAAVDGVRSTGHARGGPRTVPGLGAHAIQVATTDPSAPADEKALLSALGTGLYINRLSGSVDGASGDFSGAAKSARWVENGEVTHAVQEVMVSGNAFDLLGNAVTLSQAQTRPTGSSLLPWALVDRVSVTAG